MMGIIHNQPANPASAQYYHKRKMSLFLCLTAAHTAVDEHICEYPSRWAFWWLAAFALLSFIAAVVQSGGYPSRTNATDPPSAAPLLSWKTTTTTTTAKPVFTRWVAPLYLTYPLARTALFALYAAGFGALSLETYWVSATLYRLLVKVMVNWSAGEMGIWIWITYAISVLVYVPFSIFLIGTCAFIVVCQLCCLFEILSVS